ncbi:MAG TPA: hypothetical protein P5167_01590 [Bacteroidales bacterium]|nr:hypothetical protein [Bacteroidales bacterium]HRW94516.1 hypothetical protein [Bacteroidales bacterium]
MDIQKYLRHFLIFLCSYSFLITSRILSQVTVGWRDIVSTAGLSLMMVIIFWYYQKKHKSVPKKTMTPDLPSE